MTQYLVNHNSKVYHVVKEVGSAWVETACSRILCTIETTWNDTQGNLITTYQDGHPLAHLLNAKPSCLRLCETCRRKTESAIAAEVYIGLKISKDRFARQEIPHREYPRGKT